MKWFQNKKNNFDLNLALKDNRFELIHKQLGEYYKIDGIVSKGKQLGRTIGFPTVNLYFEEELNINKGTYLCSTTIDNQEYYGMGFYWINEFNNITFEMFIFDFGQEIYGKEIEINLIQYIREGKAISSIDELKELLKNDEKNIREIIKSRG